MYIKVYHSKCTYPTVFRGSPSTHIPACSCHCCGGRRCCRCNHRWAGLHNWCYSTLPTLAIHKAHICATCKLKVFLKFNTKYFFQYSSPGNKAMTPTLSDGLHHWGDEASLVLVRFHFTLQFNESLLNVAQCCWCQSWRCSCWYPRIQPVQCHKLLTKKITDTLMWQVYDAIRPKLRRSLFTCWYHSSGDRKVKSSGSIIDRNCVNKKSFVRFSRTLLQQWKGTQADASRPPQPD